MKFEIATALNYLSLLPAAAGALYFKHFTTGVKALALMFIAGFVAEVAATYSAIYFHNNMPVMYVYTIIEAWLLSYFIFRNSNLGKWFVVVPVVITAVALTEFTIHPLVFPSIARSVLTVAFILSLGAIVWRVAEGLSLRLETYILVGILLVYYCLGFAYFAFAGFMKGDVLLFMADIHTVINAIANILFAITLWRYTKSSSLA